MTITRLSLLEDKPFEVIGKKMKTFTIIVLILLSISTFGQNHIDTTITKYKLDSLKMVIHSLRLRYNNLYWQNLIVTSLNKRDTSFSSKDSIIVNYRTESGRLIKKEKVQYNKENCKTNSKDEYYDKNEHLVYAEYWKFNCSKEINPDPNDYTIDEYLNRYDRLQYDTYGRLILVVIHLSTPVTLRIEYQYDLDNLRHGTSRKIKENEFWD